MSLLQNVFGRKVDNLHLGMELASRRHQLLAENLANVNTPGYTRRDMDFTVHLEMAGERFPHLASMRQSNANRVFTGALRNDGSTVDLEREVSGMVETQLRFEALSELTSRYFAGLKSVVREGR